MRSSLAIFTALLVGAYANESLSSLYPELSWARPIGNYMAEPLNGNDTNTCDKLYTCQDCYTAKVCKPTSQNGIYEMVSTVPCPPERPYCDQKTGSCIQQVSESCGKSDSDFICMQDGRFPDDDCTKFHVCINLKPFSFACAGKDQKYNSFKQICEQTDVCGSYACSGFNVGMKSPHSENNRYFGYCKGEPVGALVINACPPHFKLDLTTQECVPNCEQDGIIPDPEDCHFYYLCSTVKLPGSEMTYFQNSRLMCPKGQAYSEKDFLCVDENKVQSCRNIPQV